MPVQRKPQRRDGRRQVAVLARLNYLREMCKCSCLKNVLIMRSWQRFYKSHCSMAAMNAKARSRTMGTDSLSALKA